MLLQNPLPKIAMYDLDDSSSSSGEESHASNSSSLSSDYKVTMHLYLYQNEDEEPCRYDNEYDGPSLQSSLGLLHDNDPDFKFVKILYSNDEEANTALRSLDDVKIVGQAIAKSKTVENLKIENICQKSIEFKDGNNILLLLEEMKGNRSIRHVELFRLDHNEFYDLEDEGGEKTINALEPFLENAPKLESFVVKYCRVRHNALRRLMAALMSRDSPLKSIAMECCYNIDDEAVKEMTTIFKNNPKMTPQKLSLNDNEIGDIGCYYLSKLIGNDECKLEEISLMGNREIGLHGIQSIVTAAADREVPLKKMDFLYGLLHKRYELEEFVEFFSAYPDLMPVYIQIDFEVNRNSLQGLGNMLAQRSSPIESLDFNISSIEHDSVEIFLRAFLDNPVATPKTIQIYSECFRRAHSGNLHLVLGLLLRSRLCSLVELSLSIGQISDDEMIHIATSLSGNTTLKSLHICREDPSARVVGRLTALLCDATTIMSTYNSNHALEDLEICMRDVPQLLKYLEINKNNLDKRLVATAKVIEVHFAHNFQLGNFDSMKSTVLAQVVSFVNRGFQVWNKVFNLKRDVERDIESKGGEEIEIANNNLTVNFLMVRNIPAFFDYTKPRWERLKTRSDV